MFGSVMFKTFNVPIPMNQKLVREFLLASRLNDLLMNKRLLSITTNLSSKNYAKSPVGMRIETVRLTKFMNKIITGTNNAKKKNVALLKHKQPTQHLLELGSLTKGGSQSVKPMSGRKKRRISVLNTLFIEQITSLLATGEVSPEFLGLGIQISKVKISSDFSVVNVYWYTSGTEKDEYIEKLLERTAGHLRHTLSQLRVIGIVPPIRFCKDSTLSKLQEVESLLAKCDLQDPTSSDSESLGSKHEITKSTHEIGGDSTPEVVMRQDILGVKHDVIMGEIMKAMNQRRERKAARDRFSASAPSISDNEPERGASESSPLASAIQDTEDHRKRQKEFLKYLGQKQSEKKEALRLISVKAKEQEFLLEQAEERWKRQLNDRLDSVDNSIPSFEDDYDQDQDEFYREQETFYDNFRENFK